MKMGYSTTLAAAVMVAGFASSSWAACAAKPAVPAIPNGATAKADDMNKAGKAVEAYATDFDKWLECMTKETDEAAKEQTAAINEWTKQVAAFKEKNAKK